MGAFKGKKSWNLIHIGKSAILQGLKVLHVSHELSLSEMEERYDMTFGSLVDGKEGPRKWPLDKNNPIGDWTVECTQLENNNLLSVTFSRPTIYNNAAVRKARQRVGALGGSLILKKFPSGTCSMNELENYITYLEKFENFHPDVLINDYVEKMDLGNSDELRHRINDSYLAHKKIADDRNILVVTASQVTRNAIRAPKIRKEHFSEDIQKAGNVDLALAICQTDYEIERDIGKMYVVANRSGAEDVWCQFGMCINMGQFCLWSRPSFQAVVSKEEEGLEEESSQKHMPF
jgi:hypothetical protein